ncbi:unnamed protein product [Trichogramma brassicae]|uniref:DDE Tnp4 domain-containing protein n=1 Tax=Trichogramma brassicae TaxID=86971 RepID=A0A6H5IVX7_9HYME|nr:unnamed protein product [Trichogramma brassicae]
MLGNTNFNTSSMVALSTTRADEVLVDVHNSAYGPTDNQPTDNRSNAARSVRFQSPLINNRVVSSSPKPGSNNNPFFQIDNSANIFKADDELMELLARISNYAKSRNQGHSGYNGQAAYNQDNRGYEAPTQPSSDLSLVRQDAHTDSRQMTSIVIAAVRESLMLRFVPENLGLNAITRAQYIREHVTEFSNMLYNNEPHRPTAIVYIDGTYTYTYKSSNFRALRQTYCRHKGEHLVKPALMVAPDGYILDVHGPFFSDSQNNDASMMRYQWENDENLRNWFEDRDIFIVDRGYRDVVPMLENLGFECRMPPTIRTGQNQLTTEDANEARMITKTSQGSLKPDFKEDVLDDSDYVKNLVHSVMKIRGNRSNTLIWYESLRRFLKENGGVRRFLDIPIYTFSPSIATAAFIKGLSAPRDLRSIRLEVFFRKPKKQHEIGTISSLGDDFPIATCIVRRPSESERSTRSSFDALRSLSTRRDLRSIRLEVFFQKPKKQHEIGTISSLGDDFPIATCIVRRPSESERSLRSSWLLNLL